MNKDDSIFKTIGKEGETSNDITKGIFCNHDILKRHFEGNEMNYHYAFSKKEDEIISADQARYNADEAFNSEVRAIRKELCLMISSESNLGKCEVSYTVQNKNMTVRAVKKIIDELLNLGYIVSDNQFELTNTIILEIKW